MNYTKIPALFFALCLFYSHSTLADLNYQSKNSIPKLFNEAIAYKAFPGGCIVAGTAQKIFISECFGHFTYAKKTKDTLKSQFDLASMTKVIATTAAIMKLYDQGKISLDDKVIKYIPEFKGPNPLQTKLKATITIKDLLAHSSGLPSDNIYFSNLNELYKIALIDYPRHYEIYSDVNFILLGVIIEKITGISLQNFTAQQIFQPLNMKNTTFNPNPKLFSNIVPTSYNFITDSYLIGRVNDPLAEQLGGVAGNAGLFSDANDLSIFAQMMLNQGNYQGKEIFKASTIRLFTERANLVANSSRALGWDTAFNPASVTVPKPSGKLQHCGRSCSEAIDQFTAGLYIDSEAYGHTGYTGTSLWISPKHGIFVLLLTNRISPYVCEARRNIEEYWRQRLNSAIWENLGFTQKNILRQVAKPEPTDTLSSCP